MKRFLLLAWPLLISSGVLAQPDPNIPPIGVNPPEQQPPQIPQGVAEGAVLPLPDSPESAVRFFLGALSSQNEHNLTFSVAGARVGFYGSKEWDDIRRDIYTLNNLSQLKIDAVTVEAQTESEATVTVATHRELYPAGRPIQKTDLAKYTLPLRLETDLLAPGFGTRPKTWRIVPLSNEEILAKPLYQLSPLQLMATFALHDPHLLPYLRQQRALGQLKQLALGVLQFAQDYDLIFAMENTSYERAIRPYVQKPSLFIVPTTQAEKWHFNDNLSAKRLDALAEPARTVLFYDGEAPEPDKVNFRFGDKTPIGFVDGHCKLLSKDELQNVIWKP